MRFSLPSGGMRGRISTGALLLAAACTAVFAVILAAEIQGDLSARPPLPSDDPPATESPAPPTAEAHEPTTSKALTDEEPSPVPSAREVEKPAPPAPPNTDAETGADAVPPPRPTPEATARASVEPPPPPPPARLPLPDAVVQAARLGDHSVALDPAALKNAPETLAITLHSLPGEDAVRRVAEKAGLALVLRDGLLLLTTPERAETAFRDTEVWEAIPPGDAKLAARLKRTVRFQLVGAPRSQALRLLSELLDIPVIADRASLPDGAPRPTLRAGGLPAAQALRWVSRLLGVAYVPRDGAIFLASPQAIRDALRHDAAWRPRQEASTVALSEQMQKPVSVYFVGTPVAEALAYLASHTEAPVVLSPGVVARRDAKLALSAHDLELAQALRWACREAGLAWAWRDGRILITAAEDLGPRVRQRGAENE